MLNIDNIHLKWYDMYTLERKEVTKSYIVGLRKMETIIVDRVLMHMMDFEQRSITFSEDFLELNETMQEYYDTKLKKAWNSNNLKEIELGNFASIILRSKDMIDNTEKYFTHAKTITKELFELGKMITLMPNCNIIFVECKIDGIKHMAIIKLNYKIVPETVFEKDDDKNIVRITEKQRVPDKSSAVEEAIIVNIEEDKVYLLEKKFEIDGKMDFYLNTQYLKGNIKINDKEKVSLLEKTINKVEDQYGVNEFEPKVLMKKEMIECLLNDKEINVHEVTKKIFEKDYNASEEALDTLIDFGINDNETISSSYENVEKLSKCKISTDNGFDISCDIDAYLEKNDIIKDKNNDGTYTIKISNVREIKVK